MELVFLPVSSVLIIPTLSDIIKGFSLTLLEIKQSNKPFLTASDVAEVLCCDPHSIRLQAHDNPDALGFPVVVMRSRVRIPRKAFLSYIKED